MRSLAAVISIAFACGPRSPSTPPAAQPTPAPRATPCIRASDCLAACDAGDGKACFRAGSMLRSGVAGDPAGAYERFRKGCDAGALRCCTEIALGEDDQAGLQAACVAGEPRACLAIEDYDRFSRPAFAQCGAGDFEACAMLPYEPADLPGPQPGDACDDGDPVACLHVYALSDDPAHLARACLLAAGSGPACGNAR